jgi:TPR repeat protein
MSAGVGATERWPPAPILDTLFNSRESGLSSGTTQRTTMYPAHYKTCRRHEAVVAMLVVALLLSLPASAQSGPSEVAVTCFQSMARSAPSAVEDCEKAAAENNAHALFLLALREQDGEQRIERLRQAVGLGHPRAAALLAQIRRQQGEHERANELDVIAARGGFGPSRIRIAQLLLSDKENAGNVAQARQILLAAASAGYPQAQYLVARMLRAGEGGATDVNAAQGWMLEAASSGHTAAQFELGISLIQSNPAQAQRWLIKAARAGHVGAMYQLGGLIARNAQNRNDLQMASYWTGEALRAGHAAAPQLLAQISQVRIENTPAPAADQSRIVSQVQRALSELGYDPGPADGVFGGRTRSAIIAFQRSRGLEETGVADQAVLQALEAAR